MKIELDVPLQFKGIVTVQAHSPSGELLHEEIQDNLIVNSGFAALASNVKIGDTLTNACILGRDNTPPSAVDNWYTPHGFVRGLTQKVCEQEFAGDSYCPFPQERSIVAVSENNGGTNDVYDRVDPDEAPYWWRLTRKRIFTYHNDYFKGGGLSLTNSGINGNQVNDWFDEGWTILPKEASYIAEVGWCAAADLLIPWGYCWIPAPPPGHEEAFTVPGWLGTNLWNRVVLEQRIGYEVTPPYTAWAVPDVVLAQDAIITVTLELRIHLTTDTTTQVIDVDGVPTTCRTRVIKRWEYGVWAEGVLRNFGWWRGDSRCAVVGESNTLPGTTSYYEGSDISSASGGASGTFFKVLKYKINAGIGNFATGVGGLAYGNFSNVTLTRDQCFVTVFNPKIPKTTLDRLEIHIRWTWGQWSP